MPERKPDRRTWEARLGVKRMEIAGTSEGRKPGEHEAKSERERIGNGVEKVRR